MNSEKAKYVNDNIVSCAENQSTLFKTVDKLLHGKAVQSLPAHNNIQELADRFSKYSFSKIDMIRQVLDTNFQQNTNYIQLGDITMLPTESFYSFPPATEIVNESLSPGLFPLIWRKKKPL